MEIFRLPSGPEGGKPLKSMGKRDLAVDGANAQC